MKMDNIILTTIAVSILPGVCPATTIPADAKIVVTTTTTISSRDATGKPFEGRLLQNVEVKGHSALTAGAPVRGVVESPRVNIGSSTRPLTRKLTQVSIHGRMVPIKTQPRGPLDDHLPSPFCRLARPPKPPLH